MTVETIFASVLTDTDSEILASQIAKVWRYRSILLTIISEIKLWETNNTLSFAQSAQTIVGTLFVLQAVDLADRSFVDVVYATTKEGATKRSTQHVEATQETEAISSVYALDN